MAVWVNFYDVNCHKCNGQLKKVRDCEGQGEAREIRGIGLVKGCPVKALTRSTKLYLEAYKHFRSGHLPYCGGWLNQPIKVTEAIFWIEAEVRRLTEEKQKRKK